ncbi:MAG: hypothetical protein HYR63_10370 [Proteobacteria bacterium]|nr:hypothetical protein [Pseudomonadota bacterium]
MGDRIQALVATAEGRQNGSAIGPGIDESIGSEQNYAAAQPKVRWRRPGKLERSERQEMDLLTIGRLDSQ